jgi:hypothetical protein
VPQPPASGNRFSNNSENAAESDRSNHCHAAASKQIAENSAAALHKEVIANL